MQLTAILIGSIAALATGASAASASVTNKCDFPVFVQAVPNNGAGPAGPIKRLAAGSGRYSEVFRMPAGSAIKISLDASLVNPLTMEYTPSNNLVYYDISNNAGNPLAGFRNKLTPADSGCPSFNCAPNDASCYSNGASPKIKACKTTNLKAVLCA